MKQTLKKVSALLLTIVMLCSLLGVAAFAAEPTVIAVLDKTTITKSSEGQTVTLTIKPSEAMMICNYGFKVSIPTDWSIKTISNSDANAPLKASDYNLKTGDVGWGSDDAEDYNVASFAEITYEIPANTAAGTYTINVTEILCSKTYGTVNLIEDATASVTLTIADPGASTGAEITGASSVTVGATTQLTAKLLPAGTTETITSVDWDSSSANATVTGSGETATVKGVTAGDATITAVVKTSASKTYNVTRNITVTAAKTYTVKAVASPKSVHVGDSVAVTVSVGENDFRGAAITVAYDASKFEYVDHTKGNAGDAAARWNVEKTSNGVEIQFSNSTLVAKDTGLLTLNFKALNVSETTSGSFTPAGKAGENGNMDWPAATPTADSVEIVKQFTVTFKDKDGVTLTTGGTVTVDQGTKLTAAQIPTAPAVEHYKFDKWNDGTSDYTADEITSREVTADVTYTAKYVASKYAVTLGEHLEGEAEATYDVAYSGTIEDAYYSEHYAYHVQYSVDNGQTWKDAQVSGKSFTVPGAEIVGPMSVRVSRSIQGIEFTTVADYINGYTLVLVQGSADAYSFNGSAMYKYAENAYVRNGKTYSFAYVVKGDAGSVGEQIETCAAPAGVIADTRDVNASGKVSFEDVHKVFEVANKVEIADMAMVLRADVNRDGKVDGSDINAILTDGSYHT